MQAAPVPYFQDLLIPDLCNFCSYLNYLIIQFISMAVAVGKKKEKKQPSLCKQKSTVHKLQAVLNAVTLNLSVRTHFQKHQRD